MHQSLQQYVAREVITAYDSLLLAENSDSINSYPRLSQMVVKQDGAG